MENTKNIAGIESDKAKSIIDDKSVKFWLVLIFTPTIFEFF
jgi:hypothetical protein